MDDRGGQDSIPVISGQWPSKPWASHLPYGATITAPAVLSLLLISTLRFLPLHPSSRCRCACEYCHDASFSTRSAGECRLQLPLPVLPHAAVTAAAAAAAALSLLSSLPVANAAVSCLLPSPLLSVEMRKGTRAASLLGWEEEEEDEWRNSDAHGETAIARERTGSLKRRRRLRTAAEEEAEEPDADAEKHTAGPATTCGTGERPHRRLKEDEEEEVRQEAEEHKSGERGRGRRHSGRRAASSASPPRAKRVTAKRRAVEMEAEEAKEAAASKSGSGQSKRAAPGRPKAKGGGPLQAYLTVLRPPPPASPTSPPSLLAIPPPHSPWQCVRCTLLNDGRCDECGVCDMQRPRATQPPPLAPTLPSTPSSSRSPSSASSVSSVEGADEELEVTEWPPAGKEAAAGGRVGAAASAAASSSTLSGLGLTAGLDDAALRVDLRKRRGKGREGGAAAAAVSAREGNGASGRGAFEWASLHPPASVGELPVHPRKVAEVRRWLSDSADSAVAGASSPLLVLSGPPGCGKRSMVHTAAARSALEPHSC